MLSGYRRGGDFRGRHDRYRGRLNHDHRGRRGSVGGGLTAMTFRTVVDPVGISEGYASEKDRYAKSQCGGFKSVFHEVHCSLGRFRLSGEVWLSGGSVIEDTVTMRRERLSTR
jgi:hypothetical protein